MVPCASERGFMAVIPLIKESVTEFCNVSTEGNACAESQNHKITDHR